MANEDDRRRDLASLAGWFRESAHTVFFTGAGMSTESGLPDFRSSRGLWRRDRRFEQLACVEAIEHDWDEFVAFYRFRIEQLARYRPHRGHVRIAAWQRRGLVHALVTQNVDGFHEAAGSPQVANLHGTLGRVRCHDCGAEREAESFLRDDGTRCRRCGGRMRPAVVLFGEALPEAALAAAFAASERARLFVVLGSSLLVSPANALPEVAKSRGARLVIVNREPTPLHPIADLVFGDAIGETLEALDELLASEPAG
jgi:NAD-dependent deacetylase